jgi:tRNA (guanine37-N1)-methyltransferase
MQALAGTAVPVPRLLGREEDADVLDAPFVVMQRVAGRVPQENPLYHLEGWFHDLDSAAQRRHWFSGIDTLAAIAREHPGGRPRVIHLSPRGAPLDQRRIEALAELPALTLLASRYEAVDQRLLDRHVDEEIAVGEFIVSGGELPAMMLIDALVRRLPGALNDSRSALDESFAGGLLEGPQYTRPERFEGQAVPAVLLSGHHERISRWRREQALLATVRRRPDLLARARAEGRLDAADERFLAALARETERPETG